MDDNQNNPLLPDAQGGTDSVEILPDLDPHAQKNADSGVPVKDFSSNYQSVYESTIYHNERQAEKNAHAAEKYQDSIKIASEQKNIKRTENKNKLIFTAILCVLCMVIGSLSGTLSARFTIRKEQKKVADTLSQSVNSGEYNYDPDIYTLPPASQTDTTSATAATTDAPTTSEPEPTVIPSAVINTNAAVAKTAKEIYNDVVSSVVGVTTKITLTNNLFGQSYTGESSGSGFIVSEDGYILTNYHVVEGGNDIQVSFYDDTKQPAMLVGYDVDNDIAVLKTEASGLHAVTLGESSDLSVGDTVLIIGNPLGKLSYTLTSGVVSALNRTLSDDGSQINMFQTDAAINSGNSGGPAFNMDGEVVGIATSKYADSTIEGLSFCIPIDDIKPLVADIVTFGHVKNRPLLAVSGQTLSASTASRYRLVAGIYVVALGSGGAAETAGVQKGDVITAIDGKQVATVGELKAELKQHKAGETVTLTVYRNGSTADFDIVTAEYEPAPARTTYSNVYDF